jgi:hypothetical protein
MDPLDAAVRKLRSVEGVMDVCLLDAADKKTILELEEKASESVRLVGLRIVNEAAKQALQREFVVCINHSPTLRHPPMPILVLATDEEIVGQEVWEQSEITRFEADPNAIFLGKGFVLFRDKLNNARRSPLTFEYGPQGFPEIETIQNVCDVVSATVSPATDLYVKRKAKWDTTDPSRGTVLIGFNVLG